VTAAIRPAVRFGRAARSPSPKSRHSKCWSRSSRSVESPGARAARGIGSGFRANAPAAAQNFGSEARRVPARRFDPSSLTPPVPSSGIRCVGPSPVPAGHRLRLHSGLFKRKGLACRNLCGHATAAMDPCGSSLGRAAQIQGQPYLFVRKILYVITISPCAFLFYIWPVKH
jgi:hypothetical protein